MNFCTKCGTTLPDAIKMVIPLGNGPKEEVDKHTRATETLNIHDEVTVHSPCGFYGDSVATFEQQKASTGPGKGLILALVGGLGVLFLFVFAGMIGLVYLAAQPIAKPRPIVSNPTVEQPLKNKPDFDLRKPRREPPAKPQKNEPITFPAPVSPTRRGTFVVKNVSGWQLSNIKTVPLENFRTSISGRIELEGITRRITAHGISGQTSRRVYKQFRTGALLMRTHYPNGSHSNIQAFTASTYWKNFPNEKGKIEFLINDKLAGSQSGQFSVTVTLIKIDKK